jgi:hypothetical protein
LGIVANKGKKPILVNDLVRVKWLALASLRIGVSDNPEDKATESWNCSSAIAVGIAMDPDQVARLELVFWGNFPEERRNGIIYETSSPVLVNYPAVYTDELFKCGWHCEDLLLNCYTLKK